MKVLFLVFVILNMLAAEVRSQEGEYIIQYKDKFEDIYGNGDEEVNYQKQDFNIYSYKHLQLGSLVKMGRIETALFKGKDSYRKECLIFIEELNLAHKHSTDIPDGSRFCLLIDELTSNYLEVRLKVVVEDQAIERIEIMEKSKEKVRKLLHLNEHGADHEFQIKIID